MLTIIRLSLIGLVSAALYPLLPALACRMNCTLASVRHLLAGKPVFQVNRAAVSRLFPHTWYNKMESWLKQAGYYSDMAVGGYLLLVILPIPFFYLVGLLTGIAGNRMLWVGLVIVSLINSQIGKKVKTRRKLFIGNLYKIYRFLDLQISAGIKVTDAIRGLPEATRDDQVRPCLVRLAARYELTLNLDQAMNEIREAFPGTDCELLATHLRQCLQTGTAGRSLVRMEELLFARYFNLMQQDTRQIRTQLLFTAMLGICPGILIFLYPLLFQALQAMQTIFG